MNTGTYENGYEDGFKAAAQAIGQPVYSRRKLEKQNKDMRSLLEMTVAVLEKMDRNEDEMRLVSAIKYALGQYG